MSRYYRGLIQGEILTIDFILVGHVVSSTFRIRRLTTSLSLIESSDGNAAITNPNLRAVYIDKDNGDCYIGIGTDVLKFDINLSHVWTFNCGGTVSAIRRIGVSDIIVSHSLSSSVSLRRIDVTGAQVWGVDRGNNGTAIDIDTNGDIIYGGSGIGVRLQKVNPSTGANIWSVNAGALVNSLVVRHSDNGIYVAINRTTNNVRLFDTNGNFVSERTLSGGGNALAVDIDSNEDVFAIGSSGSDRIYKLSKTLSTEITVAGGSVLRNDVSVGKDDTVYIAGEVDSSNYIFRFNNALSSVLNSFDTGATAVSIASPK